MPEGIRVDSRELDAALEKLTRDTMAMPEAHATVAGSLVPGVRDRTPRRTGALAASWESSGEADRGVISSDEPYANIVESRDHPVADTIAASEKAILAGYEEEIAKAAERIGFRVKR